VAGGCFIGGKMNSEDLEFLERINKVIYKRMSRYLRYHPEWEDAVQEAYIQAWKDYQKGDWESDFYLINRACTWAKAYLQSDRGGGRRGTGRAKSVGEGYSTADGLAMCEKTRQYVTEYSKLHNSKPKPSVMAKALGISAEYGSVLLKTYNEKLYAASIGNRDDWQPPVNMDTAAAEENSDTSTAGKRSNKFQEAITEKGFESSVISSDFFNWVCSQVGERHAQVLTMHFVYEMSAREIGEYYQYPKWPVQNGRKNINAAVKAAKEVIGDQG
jgi:RNA polymerase sigma factor (sigma-70 family)